MARLSYKSFNIGPSHDPYAADCFCYRRADGIAVCLETNGLGYSSVTFDGIVVTESWFQTQEQLRANEFLIEQLAGFPYKVLWRAWERQEASRGEDPYGPASRYI